MQAPSEETAALGKKSMHIRLYPDVLLHVQMYITLIFSGKDNISGYDDYGPQSQVEILAEMWH